MSNTNPDYNWPTLNRKDLMSLSTINKNDAKIREFKKLDTNRDWSTNLVNFDIEKSSPKPMYRFLNKPDFINKTDDLEKCSSRVWHFEINKPEYNLYNKDIKGSSPKYEKFSTNRAPHNPLEPKYKLPSYEMLPYDQPKFIRDTLNIKDIEGTSPKKYEIWKTRTNDYNLNVKKSPIRKDNMNNYNYLDYSDITKKKFKSNRNVNPLDPVYDVKYHNENIGEIDKSKPNPLYKIIYNNPMNLKTEDIKGAQIGSKNKINKFTNQVTNNLVVSDIPGTLTGSLKKHITTNRITNPVCPQYEFPGHKTAGNNFNPFAEKGNIKENSSPIKNIENKIESNNEVFNEKNQMKEKDDIMKEISEVSNNYLKNKTNDKRPKSHVVYSYNNNNIRGNSIQINKNNKEIKSNNIDENIKKDNVEKLKNNNYFSNTNNTNVKNIEENKTHKRVDSNNEVKFVGKENLKENEVIGFNNQIFNIPPLHFNPEMFKKPPPMFEYVHDRELQPRVTDKKIKSAREMKKENIHKEKINFPKNTEPNVELLKIKKNEKIETNRKINLHNNENNKINKTNEKTRTIQSALTGRSTMAQTFAEKLDKMITKK